MSALFTLFAYTFDDDQFVKIQPTIFNGFFASVLLLGMAFGYKIATITVILYLAEGALGLPVFAKGGGLIYFQGATSGYLFGFISGAFFSGYFKINGG